mmetsp:Transcript_108857/g.222112  ORF Transcript_108857/g.222112 Transcript_108857/m.222112 type:complete len:150 (+) Transcript_108857:205-654(+)
MTTKLLAIRTALLLLSLLLATDRCVGFLQKTAKNVGSNPAFRPIPSNNKASPFIFDNTKQSRAMIPSADMEAEVLTTMAHVTMDFSGFVSPSKHLLRYFNVIGRVFVIAADYIIDHSIHPEELAIQLILMTLAIKEIVVDNPSNSTEAK